MVKKQRKIKVPHISQKKMKKIWEETFGEKGEVISKKTPFRNIVASALIVNLIIIALSFLLHSLLPPEVPLYYGMPEGEDQLASSWILGLPSFLSFIILLTNIGIASLTENDFLKRTLILVGIAVTFFSAITSIKIFLLVGTI